MQKTKDVFISVTPVPRAQQYGSNPVLMHIAIVGEKVSEAETAEREVKQHVAGWRSEWVTAQPCLSLCALLCIYIHMQHVFCVSSCDQTLVSCDRQAWHATNRMYQRLYVPSVSQLIGSCSSIAGQCG